MSFFSNFFSGAPEPKKKVLSQEQLEFIKDLKERNGVFKLFSQDRIEEVLCCTVENVQFGKVIKTPNNQQEFKCEFLDARLSFRVFEMVETNPENGEDVEVTIPCVAIENAAYEEDQDQQKEKILPITSDLVFFRYEQEEENKIGYVFFLPSQDSTFAFEFT